MGSFVKTTFSANAPGVLLKPLGDWYISSMSEEEPGQDVVLIGLGGAGIKTMLTLRALIESGESSAHRSRRNSCRLLAIDSNYFHSEYFRDVDEEDLEGIHLSQKEFLSLLQNREDPWGQVIKDAKSNIVEAVDLLAKRRTILINRAPDRSDYEAMIYVSRERMKEAIRDFLNNSEEPTTHSVRPIKMIIATSLIGDTGSLSYFALLKILNELSEEIRCESISTALFGPDVFTGIFQPQTIHIARYLAAFNSISKFCFKEGQERIVPNQYLISIYPGASAHQFPRITIFRETAQKLHGLIIRESDPESRTKDNGKEPMIELMPLTVEKCLEIKYSFSDRLDSDRQFNQLVRDYSL